jgi:capsular exopolysaccharide synthesis family protein
MSTTPESDTQATDRTTAASASSADPTSVPQGGVPGGTGYGYGPGYSAVGTDSELGIVHYLQILYRRRYIATTAFLAVFVTVALVTFTSPRIYEVGARILIERDDPKVVSFEQVLQQNNEFDDYYETHYQILQSRGLARRVIESLNLWSHPHFNKPPTFSLRAFLLTPIYVAADWFAPPAPERPPDTDETQAQAAVIDQFLADMSVNPVRYSRLVDVTFRSEDAGLTSTVANAIAEAYIKQTLEQRTSTTKEASDFLGVQLEEQREKLGASEQALQAYRERNDLVSLEERQNIVLQRLEDLNAAVTRANANRIQKGAAYDQVKIALENPAAVDSMPSIMSNTFVQQQKTELAQLQRQRAQLSEKLGPNHPDMVKIGLAIQNAETRIQAEISKIVLAMRSEFEAAVAEERTLAAALNQQKQEAQNLNRTSIQYGVLQRDATANRQMFESLLQRTQETGVAEELKTGNIRVVDQAEVPSAPVSPDIVSNLLIGLLLGLTLSVGLALGLEYSDDRIKNPDELKKHLGLSFLGMIPALFDKSVPSPLISDGISAIFAESFRTIRTNVLFSSTDEGGRFVVVTSSVPGEGKTIVSSNLAIALAQAGHRVLLMDVDMRKPRVHDVFRCAIAPGLSNQLVGNATPSETICESGTPGLWLMPAGTLPPNPAELIGSKRFRDFTAFLLQHFDWVIADTPPVMAVTDATIAGNLAHGVIFVVGAEMTSRRVGQRAIEQLEQGQARFLGTVLNRVDLEHNHYYYSRYYRPTYGGYYGPPSGGMTPSIGGNGRGAAPDAAATTHPHAARVGVGSTVRSALSALVGLGSRAAHSGTPASDSFRIERHL